MSRRLLPILHFYLFLGLSLGLQAQNQPDLQADMQAQLKDKIVFIRGFFRGEHLKFNSNGELKGKAEPGVWTYDGRMEIKEVKLRSGSCVIKGDRLATIFNNQTKTMAYAKVYQTELEIELPKENSEAALIKALQHVFMNTSEKITDVVPRYWRFFLENPFAEKPPKGQDPSGATIADGAERKSGWKEAVPMGVPEARSNEAHGPDYYQIDGTPVFRATGQGTPMFYSYSAKEKKRMIPPQVVSSPDPKFPEMPRKLRMQGFTKLWTIIGTDGTAQEVQVLQPAGFGFDDAAVQAVQKWKFKPAKLDGVPVPVQIIVEVNFHLFR